MYYKGKYAKFFSPRMFVALATMGLLCVNHLQLHSSENGPVLFLLGTLRSSHIEEPLPALSVLCGIISPVRASHFFERWGFIPKFAAIAVQEQRYPYAHGKLHLYARLPHKKADLEPQLHADLQWTSEQQIERDKRYNKLNSYNFRSHVTGIMGGLLSCLFFWGLLLKQGYSPSSSFVGGSGFGTFVYFALSKLVTNWWYKSPIADINEKIKASKEKLERAKSMIELHAALDESEADERLQSAFREEPLLFSITDNAAGHYYRVKPATIPTTFGLMMLNKSVKLKEGINAYVPCYGLYQTGFAALNQPPTAGTDYIDC